MSGRAYTSTVVATGPALVAGLAGAVPLVLLAAVVEQPLVWAVSAVAVVVVVLVSIHLGTVRLSVGADGLLVGHGLRGRARRISRDAVVAARVVVLTRADVYGVGRTRRRRTLRLAAGPGPAVAVDLRSGERLVIGTPGADQVVTWIETGSPVGEDEG